MVFKAIIYQLFLRLKFLGQLNGDLKGVRLSKDLIFGKNITIGRYSKLGNDVILGNNIHIGENATLTRIAIADNCYIENGVRITGNGNGKIIIGNDCYVGINNILDYSDNIIIGNFVHIAGPSTGLWTHSSAKQCFYGISQKDKSIKYRPTSQIVIENNVYIGGNCTIYPGITIGNHSIVAPNSAVTKSIKPYSLVGGVPAKLIKKLNIDTYG